MLNVARGAYSYTVRGIVAAVNGLFEGETSGFISDADLWTQFRNVWAFFLPLVLMLLVLRDAYVAARLRVLAFVAAHVHRVQHEGSNGGQS